MTAVFHISDNETSDDVADSDPPGVTEVSQLLTPNIRNAGEPGGRVRVLSESQTSYGRGEDHDFSDGGVAEEGGATGDGTPFRGRSRSAPPALWAAQRYGRQLRRMSDEFDTLLDKGMKRVRSAGAARQMHASPSWFAFLWSHKESDSETGGGCGGGALPTSDSRAAQ